MWIHYDTNEIAVGHLKESGFRQISNGAWVKGGVAASIHPVTGSDVVCICYREIQ